MCHCLHCDCATVFILTSVLHYYQNFVWRYRVSHERCYCVSARVHCSNVLYQCSVYGYHVSALLHCMSVLLVSEHFLLCINAKCFYCIISLHLKF